MKESTNLPKKYQEQIKNILVLYNLKPDKVKITRQKVGPKDIYVAAVEESSLQEAKWLAKNKYTDNLPNPIILLEHKNKKVVYMGSNRSLVFLLKGENPDCFIVELPDDIAEPNIIKEAKITLVDIISRR